MNLEAYLKKTGQTIRGFSRDHSLSPASVWRAVKGKPMHPRNAKIINIASNGEVSMDELFYPEQK
jgi:lambda repressor-like predicted transcriptional regulator